MGHALSQAIAWLQQELRSGVALSAAHLLYWAEQDGISPRTLRRAKGSLGVVSEKDGWDGGWTWRLPMDATFIALDQASCAHYLQAGEPPG